MEQNEYQAALALVKSFEVHTHGILFGKPLNGIDPNRVIETVIEALTEAQSKDLIIRELEDKLAAREGWKLLPVEPTDEMTDAFNECAAVEQHGHGEFVSHTFTNFDQCYAAMLDAAPSQKAE